ncbi:MAG TPA: YkvA family protein, partial [Candidatus Ozemobacteraceae bacterium]|nr:YkvA family protein [Candidatus Ozemobacteraceae bacterium]
FEERSARITDNEVQAVIDQEELIWRKFKQSKDLSVHLDVMKKAMNLLRRHAEGKGGLSAQTVSAITAAFQYVLDPMDVIPDAIPEVGYLDDVVVIEKCLEIIAPVLKS